MIRALRYARAEGRVETLVGSQLTEAVADGKDPLWVDLGLPSAEETDLLTSLFGFDRSPSQPRSPRAASGASATLADLHGPIFRIGATGSRMLAAFLRPSCAMGAWRRALGR
jgi:hypothetical protein